MNLNTKSLSFCLVSVPFLISFCLTLEAGENFSGDFDVSNWSTAGSTGNGSVDTSNAPDSITINGPDSQGGP